MSPSRTIHWCLLVVLLAISRNVTLTRPSFHSRVAGCRKPYSSLRVTALGLMGRLTYTHKGRQQQRCTLHQSERFQSLSITCIMHVLVREVDAA
jgi:hypothetical protein